MSRRSTPVSRHRGMQRGRGLSAGLYLGAPLSHFHFRRSPRLAILPLPFDPALSSGAPSALPLFFLPLLGRLERPLSLGALACACTSRECSRSARAHRRRIRLPASVAAVTADRSIPGLCAAAALAVRTCPLPSSRLPGGGEGRRVCWARILPLAASVPPRHSQVSLLLHGSGSRRAFLSLRQGAALSGAHLARLLTRVASSTVLLHDLVLCPLVRSCASPLSRRPRECRHVACYLLRWRGLGPVPAAVHAGVPIAWRAAPAAGPGADGVEAHVTGKGR